MRTVTRPVPRCFRHFLLALLPSADSLEVPLSSLRLSRLRSRHTWTFGKNGQRGISSLRDVVWQTTRTAMYCKSTG